MMVHQLLTVFNSVPLLVISFTVWLAYSYSLQSGFVSDDLEGLVAYDGKLQGKEYGMISRWIRYHLCGGNFPSKHKDTQGNVVPQGKVPYRHHLLSIVVFNIASVLLYIALQSIIGPKLALATVCLFIVHPVASQAIAWCSGLGYPLSLLWMSLGLIIAQNELSGFAVVLSWIGFAIVQLLAVNALFVAIALPALLLFLKLYVYAGIAVVISLYCGFRIIKSTINLRATEFKRQNMGQSTFVKPRKLIVALKTFYYYIRLICFPKRLGLYHKWAYHYTPDVEREDLHALAGLICLLAMVAGFVYGDFVTRFAILWFCGFIFIFLNWITIQQVVADRYAFIPQMGLCLLFSHLLGDYLPIYFFVFGLALSRLWCHLPTYNDEVNFYLSNIWNFPNSEVAYGNLGVTYLRHGLLGSALDSWTISSQINPEYDVPQYNLFSHYKSNANLKVTHGDYETAVELYKTALPYIEKCIDGKICHFKDGWSKERDEVRAYIANPLLFVEKERLRLIALKADLESKPKSPGVDSSIVDIEARLKHIAEITNANPKAPECPQGLPQDSNQPIQS